MKIRACLAGLLFLASAVCLFAGEYKTLVLAASGTETINIVGDGFILLRNFTQEGGATTRGTVSVSKDGTDAAVLAASTVPVAVSDDQESINSIIIAGPATLTVTCPGDATDCVLTYRKTNGSD